MKFTVLTLFPEIPRAFFEASIMAKAVEKGIIAYDLVNVRDFESVWRRGGAAYVAGASWKSA